MSLPRRRHLVSESEDDEEPILPRWTTMNNRASLENPVTVGNNDCNAPLSFKRASTYVGNRPSAVNPVAVGNGEYEAPRSFKKATTHVKNRTWGVNSAILVNDDDEAPLHYYRRASTSVKYMPTLSMQQYLDDLDLKLQQCHERCPVQDSEGDAMTQKSEDHAKSGSVNGGRSKKKHKVTTPIPATEDTMFMGQKASQQGQQYSISRCLEVLHGMDDVSDETKVLASDVLKDAEIRELFLCYESRLRGLWLKKEVAKLGSQLPQCE
jgi:hypothetical protein